MLSSSIGQQNKYKQHLGMENSKEGKVKWKVSIDWREARSVMVRKKEMCGVEEKTMTEGVQAVGHIKDILRHVFAGAKFTGVG